MITFEKSPAGGQRKGMSWRLRLWHGIHGGSVSAVFCIMFTILEVGRIYSAEDFRRKGKSTQDLVVGIVVAEASILIGRHITEVIRVLESGRTLALELERLASPAEWQDVRVRATVRTIRKAFIVNYACGALPFLNFTRVFITTGQSASPLLPESYPYPVRFVLHGGQAVYIMLGGWSVCAVMCLHFLGTLLFACMFRMVGVRLREAREMGELRRIIILHGRLHNVGLLFQRIMSPVLDVYTVVLPVILVVSTVAILDGDAEAYEAFAPIVTMAYLLGVCLVGDILVDSSGAVAREVYFGNWSTQGVEFRRAVVLIICRASKPQKMRASIIGNMSRPMSITIFNNWYKFVQIYWRLA